jgi:hypothetical protein
VTPAHGLDRSFGWAATPPAPTTARHPPLCPVRPPCRGLKRASCSHCAYPPPPLPHTPASRTGAWW